RACLGRPESSAIRAAVLFADRAAGRPSPRLRGEGAVHRRREAGEGDSRSTQLVVSPPHPTAFGAPPLPASGARGPSKLRVQTSHELIPCFAPSAKRAAISASFVKLSSTVSPDVSRIAPARP